MSHESIHSSTAVSLLQTRCNPSKRENRQMATKKAAKKAPAKKAAKKAVKKTAKKK
jgi:topoisomerase IA-like protein